MNPSRKLIIILLVLGGVTLLTSQLQSYQVGETRVIPPNNTVISHVDLSKGAQILVKSRNLNNTGRHLLIYVLDQAEHSEYSGNLTIQNAVRSAHVAAEAAITAVEGPSSDRDYTYIVEYDSTYYIILDNSPQAIRQLGTQYFEASVYVLTPHALLGFYAAILLGVAAIALQMYDWRKARRPDIKSSPISARALMIRICESLDGLDKSFDV